MNFEEYQKRTDETAVYPKGIFYPVLGLGGECGEVQEKIKKIIRDKNGVVSDDDRLSLEKELGDVLWYVSQTATELELSLDEIAENNIRKLKSRMERNVIKGSGDER